ncbi:MAG: [protein-PII] uridylyltransferase, partial [Gammaproteobacteria bacterium]|nr:[protein-PII] uridylyltransferase [Gammaproteobacteria bacterium]
MALILPAIYGYIAQPTDNSTPFTLDHCRKQLTAVDRDLGAAFYNGTEIEPLVATRAAVIDKLLRRVWHHIFADQWHDAALLAVGGYGRGELHPRSDIDLLLLLDKPLTAIQTAQIEQFITHLWDLGLDIGHSVRTLDECVQLADEDITVATNLMESRLLCGSTILFDTIRERTSRDHIWPGDAFFQAKCDEQRQRYRKYNDTAYNLEPNIKEGPGGLRDIQTIGWVAKRHFGAERLEDLVVHQFLTDDELNSLLAGQCFLWRVRYALHLLTQRKEERLLFDYQRKLASHFGYQDNADSLAVEQFMKEYFRTITELQRLNEMLLQLFQEEFLGSNSRHPPVKVNKRFQNNNGYLEVVHEKIFSRYPFALMELFLLLANHKEFRGVRAGTIRLIRSHLHLINDKFRNDIRNRSLFIEIFRQPVGITHTLRKMNRYGVLAAYIPPFARIVGQMQHDLFHAYTVDEHTLRVIRRIRMLTVAEEGEKYPLWRDLLQRLPKPELLYIAALFHDIGKGHGGNHSEIGAAMAATFCQHHHLSSYDSRLVEWLVRQHLLMSTTAQRRDTSDPEIIAEFATEVGDENYLNYLYLLTVSDIRATSPTIWNEWKGSLLLTLFYASQNALRRGLSNPLTQQELINSSRHEAELLLLKQGDSAEAIATLWQRFQPDYFLRYTVSEICWQSHALLNSTAIRPDPATSMVNILQEGRGGTAVFIYTPLRDGLFTGVTATLDQLCLNIVDARIHNTRDGWTVDTYIILEADGNPIRQTGRFAEIEAR